MANITETPAYEANIYQLATTDPYLGGEPVLSSGSPTSGHANAQAKQLANRTSYLKQHLDTAETKLAGIADGATANSTDTQLRDRTTHTGVQPISSVSGLSIALKQTLVIPCGDETTAITAGATKATFHIPYNFTISEIFAGLSTAQVGGALFTVDVNSGGVSVFSTTITLDNTEDTSLTALTPPVIATPSLSKGSKITVDVDVIGDGTAKGLKIYLIGTPS